MLLRGCRFCICVGERQLPKKNTARADSQHSLFRMGCAIRYTVKIKNLHTGEEITQNTMEFVTFKENPEPIGVRVVEGWALSDSPPLRTVSLRDGFAWCNQSSSKAADPLWGRPPFGFSEFSWLANVALRLTHLALRTDRAPGRLCA